MKRMAAALAVSLLLNGCALTRSAYVEVNGCARGTGGALAETLYFGASLDGMEKVTEADWIRFVDEVVTPRFPAGLTWWRANGQWRNASGTIDRETSFVLRIVHPISAEPIAAIEEIRSEYRARFDQEAVMVERVRTCVDF